MADTYWLKQTESLFPELEWNKPERRNQAGKLLIVGGNIHNLGAPAKAFETAKKIGIGDTHVALPDKTKRLVGSTLPEAIFLPSTNSGEFSSEATNQLLEYTLWADTVLLPGNFGRNSQVSILIEKLLGTYNGCVVMACDGVDNIIGSSELLFSRPKTTLILSFAQLQKITKILQLNYLVLFDMDLVKLVTTLHEITMIYPVAIMTLHNNQVLVAEGGKVSTTKYESAEKKPAWRVRAAATAATFQTWNPEKSFESLTHSASLL